MSKDFSALHAYEAETKRLIQEEKKRIREEASKAYEDPTAKIQGFSSNLSNTKIDKSLKNTNIDQEIGDGETEVVVSNEDNKGGGTPLNSGEATNIPFIASSNTDNFQTTFSKTAYGVVV